MKYPSLQAAREAYKALSDQLQDIFKRATSSQDGKTVYDFMQCSELTGDMNDRVEWVRQKNAELDDIHDDLIAWQDVDTAFQRSVNAQRESTEPRPGFAHFAGGRETERRLTFGERFVASREYQEYKGNRVWPNFSMPDVDIRDVLYYEGAGWAPEVLRIPRIELNPQAQPDVLSHIPALTTSQTSIAYMEETTFTNNAAETAEAAAVAAADLIPEAALAMTLRTVPVEWLPVFIPVTQQQMEDVDGIQGYLSSRLTLMLRQRLNSQVLQGTGVPPLLRGTEGLAAHLTQAKAADPTPDAIYKAFTQIRVTGQAQPNVLFTHPNDWQDVRLLRTVDGVYIWGSPADPSPARIWGVPVVETTAAIENTMITGDYANYSALYTKRGIDIAVSDQHAFYFTRGTLAVRADMRVAMVHFRPTAFCTITGV